MDVNEILNTVFTVAIIPILSILTTFIVTFIKKKISELENSIKNKTIDKYLEIAEDVVSTVVVSINQTFVDALKKDGSFDQMSKEEAFNMAKQKILGILTPQIKEVLQEVSGDIDAWLDSKIECYVNQNKK